VSHPQADGAGSRVGPFYRVLLRVVFIACCYRGIPERVLFVMGCSGAARVSWHERKKHQRPFICAKQPETRDVQSDATLCNLT